MKNNIAHREPNIIYAAKELRGVCPEQFFDASNQNDVIVDLSLTKFIDTQSLAALLHAKTVVESSSHKITLVNPQAAIRTLLYVTNIYHLIPSFSQHLQALTFLQNAMQEQQS